MGMGFVFLEASSVSLPSLGSEPLSARDGRPSEGGMRKEGYQALEDVGCRVCQFGMGGCGIGCEGFCVDWCKCQVVLEDMGGFPCLPLEASEASPCVRATEGSPQEL